MECWHLKATYVTFGFAAPTHLLLMEAWAREGSPAGPDPLQAALHVCPSDPNQMVLRVCVAACGGGVQPTASPDRGSTSCSVLAFGAKPSSLMHVIILLLEITLDLLLGLATEGLSTGQEMTV